MLYVKNGTRYLMLPVMVMSMFTMPAMTMSTMLMRGAATRITRFKRTL